MLIHNLKDEEEYSTDHHVHKILAEIEGGDATIACWEPGQTSPNHCHPNASEIYFCFEGGGIMRTAEASVVIRPGSFTFHPPGEVHEFLNGDTRTILFRIRYGGDKISRHKSWDSNSKWKQCLADKTFFLEKRTQEAEADD